MYASVFEVRIQQVETFGGGIGVIRVYPAGIFQDGRVTVCFHGLLPVFPGGHFHKFAEMAIEIAQSAETGHFRNRKDGLISSLKQRAGMHDTDTV